MCKTPFSPLATGHQETAELDADALGTRPRCIQLTLGSTDTMHTPTYTCGTSQHAPSGHLPVNAISSPCAHGTGRGHAGPRSCVRVSLPSVPPVRPVHMAHGLREHPRSRDMRALHGGSEHKAAHGAAASSRRRVISTRATTAATAARLAEDVLDQRRPSSSRGRSSGSVVTS